MNRGFIYYYKEGFKDSIKTIKNKDNLLKYLLYMFAKMFSCILILPKLLFNLSDVKIHKMIRKSNQIDIIKSFKESSSPKTLFSVFIAVMIKLLTITGGILLIGAIGGILMLFGLFLGLAVTGFETYALYFGIPAAIVLLAYLIIYPLYFSPMNYLLQTDNSINASDAVSLSISSMKLTGKVTVFLTNLVTYLILSAYLGIIILLFYISLQFFNPALEIIFLILVLVAALGFLVLAPVALMTKNVALLMLYEDMALDSINLSKNYEGIKIRRFDAKPISIENSLADIFDQTTDEEAEIEVLKADFTVKRRKAERVIKRPEKQNLDENNDILANDLEENVEEIDEIIVEEASNEEVLIENDSELKVNELSNEEALNEDDNIVNEQEEIEEEIILDELKENEVIDSTNEDALEEVVEDLLDDEIKEDVIEEITNDELEEKEVIESVDEEIVEENEVLEDENNTLDDNTSNLEEALEEETIDSNENDELLKKFEEDIDFPKFEDEE